MRIVNFADGAESETTPVIGNIKASALVDYPDDATYEANEQGSPVEGNLYFNTSLNLIRYYTGTSWISLVDESSAQTLTNKSLDADSNTVTNIDNDEIKAGAGIDVTKLHDGSVDNAEFGHLDGVTSSIQTQLDSKQDISEKGAVNGYAPLGPDQKVPLANLPLEDIDNVDTFADFASFPATGVVDRIYVAEDTNLPYRWTGSAYIQVASSVSELSDLTDADTTGAVDGQVLIRQAGVFQPGNIPSAVPNVSTKTGSETITFAEDIMFCDSSGGTFTLTLPTAVGNDGQRFTFKKTSSDFTPIVIDANGSETINGGLTTTLNTDCETVEIVSDGSNWQIIRREIPSIRQIYVPGVSGQGTGTFDGTFYMDRDGRYLVVDATVKITAVFTGTNIGFSLPSTLDADIANMPSDTGALRPIGSSSTFRLGAIAGYDDLIPFLFDDNPDEIRFVVNGTGSQLNGSDTAVNDEIHIGYVRIPIDGWN